MGQEVAVITKVKCATQGCEWDGRIFTTTALFLNKVAALDGPFICPKCDKPMKIVDRVPANYKGSSGKTSLRRVSAPPIGKKVGKRKVSKGMTIKSSGNFSGYKPVKKSGTTKVATRKRTRGKS
jgi:hypothetical protein